MEAQYPEVEYGYIVPREEHGPPNAWGLRSAAQFIEKPDVATAQRLVDGGGLWNTMTMVFHVETVLTLLRRFCSATYRRFGRIYDAIGTPDEATTTQEVYRKLKPVNFSKGFLESLPRAGPRGSPSCPCCTSFGAIGARRGGSCRFVNNWLIR